MHTSPINGLFTTCTDWWIVAADRRVPVAGWARTADGIEPVAAPDGSPGLVVVHLDQGQTLQRSDELEDPA